MSYVTPTAHRAIKDAYYEAAGREALQAALEIPDADVNEGQPGLLLEEHMIAQATLTEIRKSSLGAVI